MATTYWSYTTIFNLAYNLSTPKLGKATFITSPQAVPATSRLHQDGSRGDEAFR
jgi:hypothetical protein